MKKIAVVYLFAVLLSVCLPVFSIEPYGLTCEYLTDPVGMDTPQPVLGWKLSSGERNQVQTSYELMVALTEKDLAEGKRLVWKTGKTVSSESFNIPYGGKALKPFTRYYWKVKVYDREGKPSGWSPVAYWETAMLSPADWKALWIGDGSPVPEREEDFYKDDPAPMFRTTFVAKGEIRSARLYITGLGYYEACLNGQRIGDNMLDPGWTKYGKTVQYTAYDVTSMLSAGENAIGVTLGNGFYNPLPMPIFRPLRQYLDVGRPCFIAQISIRYADGREDLIVSDSRWKTFAKGPVVRNNVYLGEHYDARNEQTGWDTPDFDDSQWQQARQVTPPAGRLSARMQPPIRVTKVLHPVRMTETRPGVFIFDMGQNMAGVVRIRARGQRGAKIAVRYGEDVFPDGNLNVMTSVAGQQKRVWNSGWDAPGQPPVAWQEDTYTLKGEGEEVWSPRFTFHGFRYVEITGFPGR
ncbi:MAG: family 78 glycoside hydrolase catalytic domain, partial [Bacteroidales bacterium]|nr:family 78 glycoside hydrolase catalytic domain [Bacteroidales bacterium]